MGATPGVSEYSPVYKEQIVISPNNSSSQTNQETLVFLNSTYIKLQLLQSKSSVRAKQLFFHQREREELELLLDIETDDCTEATISSSSHPTLPVNTAYQRRV